MDNKDKIKVQLERGIVEKLIQNKKVGETYSDVLKRLLKWK